MEFNELPLEIKREIERLRAEVDEQCRLNGCGSEREAKLRSDNDALRAELAALKAHGEPAYLVWEPRGNWRECSEHEYNATQDNDRWMLYLTPQPAGNAELVKALREIRNYIHGDLAPHWDYSRATTKSRKVVVSMIDAAIAKAEGVKNHE